MPNAAPSDEITQELQLPEAAPGPPWRDAPREEVLVSMGACSSMRPGGLPVSYGAIESRIPSMPTSIEKLIESLYDENVI